MEDLKSLDDRIKQDATDYVKKAEQLSKAKKRVTKGGSMLVPQRKPDGGVREYMEDR